MNLEYTRRIEGLYCGYKYYFELSLPKKEEKLVDLFEKEFKLNCKGQLND